MSEREIALEVIQALESLNVPYMVVGSFSSNIYGVPRSTRDIDIVLESAGVVIKELIQKLGSNYKIDPQLAFEGVTGTKQRVITRVDSAFSIELFWLSEDPFDQSRFSRRLRRETHGGRVWVATAEDVIIQKLRWWVLVSRSKDLEDVREVLAVQYDNLDWNYIEYWCDKHGSRAELDRLRGNIRQTFSKQ